MQAQQPAVPVIGWLTRVPRTMELFLPSFSRGLAEAGYVVGRRLLATADEVIQ